MGKKGGSQPLVKSDGETHDENSASSWTRPFVMS